jgi:hypothetical protein
MGEVVVSRRRRAKDVGAASNFSRVRVRVMVTVKVRAA